MEKDSQEEEIIEEKKGPSVQNTSDTDDEPHESRHIISSIGLFFLEMIKIGILAGLTIGLVRYFLFKPFYVKGQSMEPTYYEHEYLIVDEISYRFRDAVRGEVIVFRSATNPGEFYLKRVIGLPGERVVIKDGKVIVYNVQNPQGLVLHESYIDVYTDGSVSFTLEPNHYFVLGDNRGASYDSRRFGPISSTSIIGRTVFRGWPFNRMGMFSAPNYET